MTDKLKHLGPSNAMALSCKFCNHVWLQDVDLPIPMDGYLKLLRTLRCQACSAGVMALSIHFGKSLDEIKAAMGVNQ